MMRLVVALITGVLITLYFMFFMYPLMYSTHQNFANMVNTSDTVIVSSYNLGSGIYTALPFIPILVGVFIIFSVALRRDAD